MGLRAPQTLLARASIMDHTQAVDRRHQMCARASALITILMQDPAKQATALEIKVLTELARLGVVPPFTLDTICDIIVAALITALGYPIVLRPHATQDEGVSRGHVHCAQPRGDLARTVSALDRGRAPG